MVWCGVVGFSGVVVEANFSVQLKPNTFLMIVVQQTISNLEFISVKIPLILCDKL